VVSFFGLNFTSLYGSSELIKINCPAKPKLESSFLNDDTALEVEIVGLSMIIKNVGDADAVNVWWEMQLKCPLLIVSPGKQSGNIDLIKSGEEKIVNYSIDGFLFGFGVLKLKGVAKADNACRASDVEPIGFLLGPLILIFP
jgi:hypothetical protein